MMLVNTTNSKMKATNRFGKLAGINENISLTFILKIILFYMIVLSIEQVMVIFKYNHSHVLSQQLQLFEVLHALLVRLS